MVQMQIASGFFWATIQCAAFGMLVGIVETRGCSEQETADGPSRSQRPIQQVHQQCVCLANTHPAASPLRCHQAPSLSQICNCSRLVAGKDLPMSGWPATFFLFSTFAELHNLMRDSPAHGQYGCDVGNPFVLWQCLKQICCSEASSRALRQAQHHM